MRPSSILDPATAMIELKRGAERACARAIASGEKRTAAIFSNAAEQVIEHENPAYLHAIARLKRTPVTIDEFVESKEFLGGLMDIWPTLMPDLRDMNPDVWAGRPGCHEILNGGSTGTGKTATSSATTIYQAYLFTCLEGPQKLYNLSAATPLVFMLQSVSTTVTKRVIYAPIRTMFTAMPYTQKWVSFDKHKESELSLEGNIHIVPALASLQAMVGQAIPGAILDEVNFMQIIEASKQVAGPNGLGGHYDQAEVVYRNISRRRKRSFLTKGVSIGAICCVSSTRYKGDFLDRRIDEVAEFGEQNILTLRRKQYEVAPQDRYSGVKFNVLIGTDDYPTRVLADEEQEGLHYPDGAQVEPVPIELRSDFLRDPEAAQRDYIGIASNAITPFITQRHKIVDAILAGKEMGLRPWVVKQNVDLQLDGMPQIDETALPSKAMRARPHYVHVDLSEAKDRCGIGMACPMGHENIVRDSGVIETLPVIAVSAAITIQPSATKKLDPSDVRQWIMQLIRFYDFNIVCVTYDGYQSSESINLFRKAGIRAENISLDRTTEGYDILRRGLYDDRIPMVDNDLLRQELSTLEYIKKKKKVDHPPRGSKDAADGVAGAVYRASMDRSVMSSSGVVEDDGSRVVSLQSTTRPSGRNRPQGSRR